MPISFLNRPKVAIVHPQFIEGGGSEAPALWAAQALKDNYNVSIISMGKIDLDSLNKCYGTNLSSGEINTIAIPIPLLFKNRFDALRGYRLIKYCKHHASEYDLMISSYNVMDFGKKGIQYISDFSFEDRLRRAFDSKPKKLKSLFYRASPFRTLYLQLGLILGGTSKDGWKKNLTISNSNWSGKIMKEYYGIETKTIFPPVVNEFPDIPWDSREEGFVCIGRLVPEKKIEQLIEILRRVREKGWNIHLHVIGTLNDSDYVKELQKLCRDNIGWIVMEGAMFGQEKAIFLSKHKFGIHGREREPLGIAVAEMVKAGCITFVPSEGGQAEIVDHDALTYDGIDDAVTKIDQVLRKDQKQNILRDHLKKQGQQFSVSNFMDGIKASVNQFLNIKQDG